MEEFKNKYNEALERARKIHNDTEFEYEKGMMEEVFPELSESEDESILKALLRGFKKYSIYYDTFGEADVNSIIAWLENQKESVDNTKYDKKIEDYSKVQRICKYLNEVKKYCGDINEIRECINWLKSLVKLSEEPKIQKGKRYICPEYSDKKHNKYFKKYDKDNIIREIIIKALTGEIGYLNAEDTNECVEWLKSFDESKKESSNEE